MLPAQLDDIDVKFRDSNNPPTWVGMDVWAATICYNTIEAQKLGLSKTHFLARSHFKPEYKGKIVMPNPASSGTGFLDVSAWLQIFCEQEGWA